MIQAEDPTQNQDIIYELPKLQTQAIMCQQQPGQLENPITDQKKNMIGKSWLNLNYNTFKIKFKTLFLSKN